MKEIGLKEILLLFITAQQKEDLCLERIVFGIFVELRQEGIFLEPFKNEACAEPFRKHLSEGGLTGADDSFYSDMSNIRTGNLQSILHS